LVQKWPSGLKEGSNHPSNVINQFPNSLPVKSSVTLDAMFSHMWDAIIKSNEDKEAQNKAIQAQRSRGALNVPDDEELAVMLDQVHYLSMMSQTVATMNSDSSNTMHTSTIPPTLLSTSTNVQTTCIQLSLLTMGANTIPIVSQPCVNPNTLMPTQTPLTLVPIPLNACPSNTADLNVSLTVIAANAGSKTQAINYSQA